MTLYQLGKACIVRLTDAAIIPLDPANTDYAAYLDWIAAGNTPDPTPTPTAGEQIAINAAAIQAELDRQAQAKGYDNIVSACSYAAQTAGDPFQAEGAAFLSWRSIVWLHAHDVLAQVQAGTVPMPTPVEAVAAMPALVLP
jgi:hypothetical protein